MNNRLSEYYKSQVSLDLFLKFNYINVLETQNIQKVIVSFNNNSSQSEKNIKKQLVLYFTILFILTGQKPIFKQSELKVKYKKNKLLSCYVTLRKNTMYSFLDKLINTNLPKIRNLKNFNQFKYDKNGNLIIYLKDLTIFDEVEHEYKKFRNINNINIIIILNTKSEILSSNILSGYQFPYSKK